jgi:hypothetical protein
MEAHMESTKVEVLCTSTVIAIKYSLNKNYVAKVAVNYIWKKITVSARGCKRVES